MATNDEIKNLLTTLTTAVDQLKTSQKELSQNLDKKTEELTQKLEKKTEELTQKLDKKTEELTQKLDKMQVQMKQFVARQANSLKGKNEPLEKVPIIQADGTEKIIANLEYPTIAMLIVAGNEVVPGTDAKNPWNAEKSLKLIREYDPGYTTDDNNKQPRERQLSLKLAQCLGVTPSQINLAATAYYLDSEI